MATDQDRIHLRRALELAAGGHGRVSPNPMVGAVIVRDGQVLGEGFHAELGGPHAEVEAIEDSRARGIDPAGATLLVTLEPCAHHGRQPPCADAIRDAGIARVVIASDDPSAKANGTGPTILRKAGVEVEFVGRRGGRGGRAPQPALPKACADRAAADRHEVSNHARRPGGDCRRRFAVDLQRGEPPAGTPLARRGRRRLCRASARRWRMIRASPQGRLGPCASRPGLCSTPRPGSR